MGTLARRAIMSADPQVYRRMLSRAAHLLSGEDVPADELLAQLKALLARRPRGMALAMVVLA